MIGSAADRAAAPTHPDPPSPVLAKSPNIPMSPAVLDAAGIMDDLTQTRILAQEHLAIELLAQDTHTDIGTVQTLFLAEFARLSATAHIQSFVSVLAAHRVKDILKAQTTTLPAD